MRLMIFSLFTSSSSFELLLFSESSELEFENSFAIYPKFESILPSENLKFDKRGDLAQTLLICIILKLSIMELQELEE